MRGIFFDEDDAAAAAARLVAAGYAARVARERLHGEDDDEDHPWAVLTDAPEPVLDLLVDEYDGWLDTDDDEGARGLDRLDRRGEPPDRRGEPPDRRGEPLNRRGEPLELPDAPRRLHRPQ